MVKVRYKNDKIPWVLTQGYEYNAQIIHEEDGYVHVIIHREEDILPFHYFNEEQMRKYWEIIHDSNS